MRIHVIAVGRARRGPEVALYDHFAGRVTAWPMVLREVESRGRIDPAKLRETEAGLLLDALPSGAVVVALDEAGRQLRSRDLAARIGAWRDAAVGDLAFVIGGAEGLHELVRNRAEIVLSLGLATWPHLLARGMLAEQIYRAQQILAGHPYHRD
jgi:23S rRNA (pseudouridine1915-N3)-methyltransferase